MFIGWVGIYDDGAIKVQVPAQIGFLKLQKLYLASVGARNMIDGDMDSPEMVKIAAGVLARAGARKRKQ